MQSLNPKAVGACMATLNYESHIFLQSLFQSTKGGVLPVDPAHYAGRYALK